MRERVARADVAAALAILDRAPDVRPTPVTRSREFPRRRRDANPIPEHPRALARGPVVSGFLRGGLSGHGTGLRHGGGARQASTLSQAEVARRIGASQAMVARWETGKAAPTTTSLRRFAEATGARRRIECAFERD
ncbi:helix-turn-helix domain-containing protein [Methylobacterium sp. SyP6R]|uniref:helix-turn-helix domain-containing protein n=1 Tax=Methylobacterium sp. SyP6R TaxID=2718876 RepID=UPI003FA5AB55